jgi:hypothetical protein
MRQRGESEAQSKDEPLQLLQLIRLVLALRFGLAAFLVLLYPFPPNALNARTIVAVLGKKDIGLSFTTAPTKA